MLVIFWQLVGRATFYNALAAASYALHHCRQLAIDAGPMLAWVYAICPEDRKSLLRLYVLRVRVFWRDEIAGLASKF